MKMDSIGLILISILRVQVESFVGPVIVRKNGGRGFWKKEVGIKTQ